MMNEIVKSIAAEGAANDHRRTYTDANGITRCMTCGDPTTEYIDGIGTVPVACKCDKLQMEAQERRKRAEAALEAYRSSPFYDRGYTLYTFDKDTAPESAAGKACRKYVKHWTDMKAGNYGVIFMGTPGTGKSFYAACIMNALHQKGISAAMVNAALLVDMMKVNVLDTLEKVGHFSLLIVDDLGAEGDNSFVTSLMLRVIDARTLAGKPLIVTTNMTAAELEQENGPRARMYDRINVMCPIRLPLTGESRRRINAKERREAAAAVLLK